MGSKHECLAMAAIYEQQAEVAKDDEAFYLALAEHWRTLAKVAEVKQYMSKLTLQSVG